MTRFNFRFEQNAPIIRATQSFSCSIDGGYRFLARTTSTVFQLQKWATAPDGSILLLPQHDPEHYELVHSCRKCRGPLFRPNQLVEHEVGRHNFSYRRTAKDIVANDGDAQRAGHSGVVGAQSDEGLEDATEQKSSVSRSCTSYFLQDALQWMKDASHDVEGKLTCPHGRCGARLGMLRWAGGQCSCGTWVTPAIQLNKSAIDERYFERKQGGTAADGGDSGSKGPGPS